MRENGAAADHTAGTHSHRKNAAGDSYRRVHGAAPSGASNRIIPATARKDGKSWRKFE
jgi:hypothetical protein